MENIQENKCLTVEQIEIVVDVGIEQEQTSLEIAKRIHAALPPDQSARIAEPGGDCSDIVGMEWTYISGNGRCHHGALGEGMNEAVPKFQRWSPAHRDVGMWTGNGGNYYSAKDVDEFLATIRTDNSQTLSNALNR